LYINANRESDCIVFSKRATGDNFIIQSSEYTAFNSNEFTVPVHTGDLVLFPSNLIHSVPKTNHDYTRVSLAFNSFFSGELGFVNGDMSGINYLKLDLKNQK
jgi:ectoine hydroxylase-related dioxygenase (phytanoyl-CoA dioxygenase family)